MTKPFLWVRKRSGWVFPAWLIASVGLHSGVFLWQLPAPWKITGAASAPAPLEMILWEEPVPIAASTESPLPEPEIVSTLPPTEETAPLAEIKPAEEPTSPVLPDPTPPAGETSKAPAPANRPAPASRQVPSAEARSAVVEARPDARHMPAPRYPDSARRAGQQGRVLVRAEVDGAGRVRQVAVVASSGFPALDRAAVEAVRRWRFSPRLVQGKPAPATVEVPVHFSLDG